MTTPQLLADYAVERRRSTDCVVIVEETSGANLRWANSSLTTNGTIHGIQATMIAIEGGRSVSVT